jgi:hypothetical protein
MMKNFCHERNELVPSERSRTKENIKVIVRCVRVVSGKILKYMLL